tara:strand:+ start:2189 stop:3307 length:1119 start_codon:yes stop_codon:yes gene_type:complete
MAIYHLTAQVISRSSGRSAIAAAAYRHGIKLVDERTGEQHDYSRKKGVEHSEIIAQQGAPDWVRDHGALWNTVEAAENRKDAQLAREIEISIPRELSPSQSLEAVRSYVHENFVNKGMVADLAIHTKKSNEPDLTFDGLERHAHIMLTMRQIDGGSFGKKDRSWNDRKALEAWRENWAQTANQALQIAGRPEQIDHRTLQAQKVAAERSGDLVRALVLDRPPEPKLGAAVSAMERKANARNLGARPVTERGQRHQKTREQALDAALEASQAASKHGLLSEFLEMARQFGTSAFRRWAAEGLQKQVSNLRDRINPQKLLEVSKHSTRRKLNDIAAGIFKSTQEKRAKQNLSRATRQPARSNQRAQSLTKSLER